MSTRDLLRRLNQNPRRTPHAKSAPACPDFASSGPFARLPAVLAWSPEVIPCQDPHAQRRRPRARHYHSRNESSDEPMNCTSCKAINQVRSSTTGSKPKRRFVEPRKKPSTKTDFGPPAHSVTSGYRPFRLPGIRCRIGPNFVRGGSYGKDQLDPGDPRAWSPE